MSTFQFESDRYIMACIDYDADLIRQITDLAISQNIEAATFTAVGALKRATLGYYDQIGHKYREIDIDSPHEIASCIGNISIKKGAPFVHAHVVLADDRANTRAGHLLRGAVFAAEVHITTLAGPGLERKYDDITGLWLWHTTD